MAGWILELDRGQGIPWKGIIPVGWIKMAPKARQAKSKVRLGTYENLLGEEVNQKEVTLELFIPPGPRLGSNVIDVEGVSKSYGDKLLFDNLHFSLPQGGIVGVIGPNGAGKSTLLKLITGKEIPDSGTFKVGASVLISYVDQEQDQLSLKKWFSRQFWEVMNSLIPEVGK